MALSQLWLFCNVVRYSSRFAIVKWLFAYNQRIWSTDVSSLYYHEFVCVFTLSTHRVKRKADLVGAFKCDPLYLKHKNQGSGTVSLLEGILTDLRPQWLSKRSRQQSQNTQIFGVGAGLRQWQPLSWTTITGCKARQPSHTDVFVAYDFDARNGIMDLTQF